jgi:nucleotide-binding universal stress UspA family protein
MNRIMDEQLLDVDVPAAVAAGRLSGDPIAAAAIQADRLDVLPRSLTFLAEIVRRGGISFAANLPEPMPTPEQSALARSWLAAGAGSDEIRIARWLDAVAVVLGARRATRLTSP